MVIPSTHPDNTQETLSDPQISAGCCRRWPGGAPAVLAQNSERPRHRDLPLAPVDGGDRSACDGRRAGPSRRDLRRDQPSRRRWFRGCENALGPGRTATPSLHPEPRSRSARLSRRPRPTIRQGPGSAGHHHPHAVDPVVRRAPSTPSRRWSRTRKDAGHNPHRQPGPRIHGDLSGRYQRAGRREMTSGRQGAAPAFTDALAPGHA